MSRRIGPPPTWDSDAFGAAISASVGDIGNTDDESLVPATKEHEVWLLNGEKGHVAVPSPGDMCCECPPDEGTGAIGSDFDPQSRCGRSKHRRWGVPSAGVEGVHDHGEEEKTYVYGEDTASVGDFEVSDDDTDDEDRALEVGSLDEDSDDNEVEDGDESGGEADEVVEGVEESGDGAEEYADGRDESDHESDGTSTVGSGVGEIEDEDDDGFVGALRARMKELDVSKEVNEEPRSDSFLLDVLG